MHRIAVVPSVVALCAAAHLASSARAQVLGWLPVTDLPLSQWENDGGPITPAISSMCLWDPDGPGPRGRSVFAAGVLNLAIPNGMHIAFFDNEEGWVGIAAPTVQGDPSSVYSMVTYAAPGDSTEKLYASLSYGGVYRRDGLAWTRVSAASRVKFMSVLDLDGAGPLLPSLVIGAADGVYVSNGTTFTRLNGGTSPTYVTSVLVWDSDGEGPLPARLLAAGHTAIYEWNGTQWTLFARTTVSGDGTASSLITFDFDGDGPNPPQLVAAGWFGTIGGTPSNRVATLHNGTWVDLGGAFAGDYISRIVSFDPDGPGPLQPRLVAAGSFTQLGGVSARGLACYIDNAWHAFPEPWAAAESSALLVNTEAEFSDSPQLLVGSLRGGRPTFGIFALSNTEPGYQNDPFGGRRPQGETLSLGITPTGDELSFRWYKGNTPVQSGTTASGSIISGSASPRLTIANLTPQDQGEYHVVIANAIGTVATPPIPVSLGCTADFNADDVLDLFDYLDFVAAFANNDPVTDFNGDRQFDLEDYFEFITHFANGC